MKFGRRRAYAALTAAALMLGMVTANAGAAPTHITADTLTTEWSSAPGVVLSGDDPTTPATEMVTAVEHSVLTLHVGGASANHRLLLTTFVGGSRAQALDNGPGNQGVPHIANNNTAYADANGDAWFAVQIGAAGTHSFTINEFPESLSDNANEAFLVDHVKAIAATDRTGTTITRSVGRVSTSYSTGTVVVQAMDSDKHPLSGQHVTLAATHTNPFPPAELPFSKGFFGSSPAVPTVRAVGATDPNGQPTDTAITDSHGVAVFSVTGSHVVGVAYFTPVFLDGEDRDAVPQSTAVIFTDAPPFAEDSASYVVLNNAFSEASPTEQVVPADGVTSVVVYARTRCSCRLTGDEAFLVTDDHLGMPAATEGIEGPYIWMKGAAISMRTSGNGSHAVITPLLQTGNHGAFSQDQLAPDEAWTDANGVAAFLVTDAVGEDVTLEAFDTTNNVLIKGFSNIHNGSVTLHFVPASPYKDNSTVSVTPDRVPADGTSTATITVTARDITRRAIAGRTIVLRTPSVTASMQSSSVVTDINGVAKFQVSNSRAEKTQFTVTDSSGGMLGTALVDFRAAAPSGVNSRVEVTLEPVHTNDGSTGHVKVHLADSAGNPDSCLAVTLDQNNAHSVIAAVAVPIAMRDVDCLAAPDDPTSDHHSLYNDDTPVSVHTDKNGDAFFDVTDLTAEDVLYTAHIGEFLLSSISPIHFIAGAMDPDKSSVASDVTNIPAGGKNKATITVTLHDSNQNPLAGNKVTLAATDSAVTSTISPSGQVTTNADGVATFVVSDPNPEAVTFKATVADGAEVGQWVLSFTGKPIGSDDCPLHIACSAVTASDVSVPVGSLVTVHGTVRDIKGQAISGEHLNISTFGGTVYQAGESSGNATDDSGTAGFVLGSSSPGVVEVTVLDGLITLGKVNVTFFGPAATDLTTIAVQQEHQPVGSDDQITVTVKDAQGFPVSGQLVTLTKNSADIDDAELHITPADGLNTDPAGVATFQVSSTHIGSATFVAHVGTIDTHAVAVEFVAANTEASNSMMSAVFSNPMHANGTDKATVTVTLLDGQNQPIPNATVTLECRTKPDVNNPNKPIHDATETEVSPAGATPNEYTFEVTALDPDLYRCLATDVTHAVPLFNSVDLTFDITPTEANQSDITASARTVSTDETVTISVSLKTAAGAAIDHHTVKLTGRVGNGTPFDVGTASTEAGLATFEVSHHAPETVTFSATDTDANPDVTLEKTAVVTFSDERATSTVTTAPSAVPADGHSTSAIIVALLNNGLPVVGHKVVLQPQNGSSDITVKTNPTGQDGRATFLVSDTAPEVVTYDVVDTDANLTLTAGAQVAFTTASRPAPTVTSMTPTSGGALTAVTIKGTGLSGAGVNFGSVPAQTLTVNAQGTQIVATAPGGTGAVSVKVMTPGGTTTAGTFTYDASTASVHKRKHGGHPAGRPVKAARREDRR